MSNKIRFEQDKLIIDDNYKAQQLLLKAICIINFITAIMNLAAEDFNISSTLNLFWLFFALLNMIGFYFAGKKSAAKEIEFDNILSIYTSKSKKQYYLKLKNGQSRDFPLGESKEEDKIYIIPQLEKKGIPITT